ncbi:MAG TPA: VWA domain-containing protein, partial [Pyrinomonadaceae bacterium]|nr:VWA domain-containing protein [Pyrinomonadaceae bacterium]
MSNPASSAPSPTPTPTPAAKEEILQDSDEVVRVETNLTSIFFTAADSSKRFINNLTKEDIRILEDGQTQEIFTFQKNLELPLSIAILIDTSRSEERTLPDEKAAARAFVEAVMRPDKDEAAIVSFTGEVTLEQGFTGNLDRLRRAIDRVEFVPPSGYIGGGVVVGG